MGLCPFSSVVWASPKFVRPHRWGYWVKVRFLEILWVRLSHALLGIQSCQIFIGLKRCASKNTFLRCNKSGKSGYFHTKRKVVEKPHRFGRHWTKIGPNPNVLAYSKSPWAGEICMYGFMSTICQSKKISCVSKIPPGQLKNLRITVSVFLSTLQLTALPLKSVHLRFHCYTLLFMWFAGPHLRVDLNPRFWMNCASVF